MRCVNPNLSLAPTWDCNRGAAFYRADIGRLIEAVSAQNVTVVGNSAGGGLSLAAAQWLRDAGHPQPNALILICPGVNGALSLCTQAVAARDVMQDVPGMIEAFRMYAGGLDVTAPPFVGHRSECRLGRFGPDADFHRHARFIPPRYRHSCEQGGAGWRSGRDARAKWASTQLSAAADPGRARRHAASLQARLPLRPGRGGLRSIEPGAVAAEPSHGGRRAAGGRRVKKTRNKAETCVHWSCRKMAAAAWLSTIHRRWTNVRSCEAQYRPGSLHGEQRSG